MIKDLNIRIKNIFLNILLTITTGNFSSSCSSDSLSSALSEPELTSSST
jgi:hypothetical protein